DLDHPRHDCSACGLPDERRCKPCRQDQAAEGHKAPVAGLHTRRTDTLVPDLRGALIGRLGFGRLAVVGGWAFEQGHLRSPSERLMEEPEPPLSPERTAWAVAIAPWLMAWLRRIRCAQAGGPSGEDEGAALTLPPIVPIVDEPPVAAAAAW